MESSRNAKKNQRFNFCEEIVNKQRDMYDKWSLARGRPTNNDELKRRLVGNFIDQISFLKTKFVFVYTLIII